MTGYFSAFFLFFCSFVALQAQDPEGTATIYGQIRDFTDQEPVPGSLVFLLVKQRALGDPVSSDEEGYYKLIIPANEWLSVRVQMTGFQTQEINRIRLKSGELQRIDIVLKDDASTTFDRVDVRPFEDREADAQRIKGDDVRRLPSLTGNIESVLQFMAVGVSAGTGGELTSQYSVRGGNYDENLIYVNGFEIYRPLLIRSGQQEGLTFPNPDMLESLSFSSGGFKAQYDDKMSSVLDIQYRRPKKFEAAASGSALGGSAYIGGALYKDSAKLNPYRLSYTLGARYKTTRYILNSLPIQGEYVPQFFDVQGNVIYDFGPRWQLEALGNYSNSVFRLDPVDASTTTGLFNQALRLTSLFAGREISNFETWMAGTALSYRSFGASGPGRFRMRFQVWHYESSENERIDIENTYRLDEVQSGLGEDDFGEVVGTLAYGTTHLYARNALFSQVTNAQWRGAYIFDSFRDDGLVRQTNHLQWGLTYKHERIDDKLREWTRLDSLGYTLPYDTTQIVFLDNIRSNVQLLSHRFMGFVQNTWELYTPKHQLRVTAGLRANYWTLNEELILSPRMQIYYTPLRYTRPLSDTSSRTKDLTFKLAIGAYHQPPFYRELRNLDGEVNRSVRAQKSIHYLAGLVWDFVMFKRRFKFVAESYYKDQWDLVPYDVDNVRIRYYGENLATGYVTGLDLRLNGELVPGLESWVNLSLMRARENFEGVDHKIRRLGAVEFDDNLGRMVQRIDTIDLRDVPKPTDQFLLMSMYFQDDFPGAPWFRVNLALTVGTGFPFGVPRSNIEYRNLYRFNPYHRIDIGFMFMLWQRDLAYKKSKYGDFANEEAFARESKHKLRFLRNAWLSVEVFNLMGVANTASNTWIKDFTNRSYAVPNLLSTRRINLKFRVEF